VTPLISSFMSREIAETLGAPLLWAVFDNDFNELLPEELRVRIKDSY